MWALIIYSLKSSITAAISEQSNNAAANSAAQVADAIAVADQAKKSARHTADKLSLLTSTNMILKKNLEKEKKKLQRCRNTARLSKLKLTP